MKWIGYLKWCVVWESRGGKTLLICAPEYYLNVFSTQAESIVLWDQRATQKLGNLTYQHLKFPPHDTLYGISFSCLWTQPCRDKEFLYFSLVRNKLSNRQVNHFDNSDTLEISSCSSVIARKSHLLSIFWNNWFRGGSGSRCRAFKKL